MEATHYCQIYEDNLGKPRCRKQCGACKRAKQQVKEHKKNLNSIRSKRYYLHGVIKKQGCKFNARNKTIFVPYTQSDYSKQVMRLRDEFGYSIQTEIV